MKKLWGLRAEDELFDVGDVLGAVYIYIFIYIYIYIYIHIYICMYIDG